jgi:cytoskeletal protein RodZ
VTSLSELGARLRTAREKKKLGIAQLAQTTGLPERYLEALEAGDLTPLPGRAYARMYFSTYARALDLDSERLLLEWPQEKQEIKTITEPTTERPQWLYPAVFGGALLVLIWLILRCAGGGDPAQTDTHAEADREMQRRLASPVGDSATVTSSGPITPSTGTPDSMATAAVKASEPEERTPAAVHVLVVEASTQTWVVIEADGDTVAAEILSSGQSLRAEAARSLILTVGRPQSVAVMLDEITLELPIRQGGPLVRHRLLPAGEGTDS